MTKRIIALLLALILAFSLFSCTEKKSDDKNKEETTQKDEGPSALEVFEDAAKVLSEMTSLKKEISIETVRTVGNQEYEESIDCTVDLKKIGEDFFGLATGKMVLESGIIDTDEIYSSGKIYCQYGDESEETFISDMDAETFLSRYLPSVIFDGELYGSVSFAKDDKTTILLKKAKGLEKWLAPEYATLSDAAATVKLSDGKISEMIYTVEYTQGPAKISSEYTVKVSESIFEAADVNIKIPAIEDCIEVSDIDIPLYLAYAHNGIKNSATLMGGTDMEIVLPEAGVAYSSSASYSLYSGDEGFVSKIDTSITVQDVTGMMQTEVVEEYKDKKATQTVDGGEAVETVKKPADFKAYIKEDLATFLYEPTLFSKTEVIHADEFLLLEYEFPNDSEVGINCEDYICDFLYGDPDAFDQHSEGYATNGISGYVAIDKDTRLPTAIGFSYTGSHMLEGQTLNMILNATQSISCGTDEAYTEVTDEYPAEKEPENKATPLLYEVTAENGAKMYLLGTIHIADNRAAYLPDELYAALDEADVLAVEIDDDDFEAQLEADDKLMAMLQESYYYQDGTTIKDHVSEEIYEYGVAAMKISGNYRSYAEMMRPSLWSSTLDYFLIDSSMILNSYKGIDERLIRIAKDSEKPVRSIEAVEGRLSMELSYPEKAHELILGASLSRSRAELMEQSMEMYELWCEGDEKKLREYLGKEPEYTEDTTEEEIAAYEEYIRIMETDRDAIMLDAAKKYLENTEEVVFYAVGMAHVLGKTGLVDALREAGYTVTAVEYK